MDFEDQVGTLTRLGLTPNQARIYLILSQRSSRYRKPNFKDFKAGSPKVYRVMAKLQELGLVEVRVEAPTKYRAHPLSDGIHTLLNRKTEEDKRLQEEVGNLLKHSIKGTPELTIPEGRGFEFSLLFGMDWIFKKEGKQLIILWRR